jgi:phosphoribosylglycinamide formyltransferase-1
VQSSKRIAIFASGSGSNFEAIVKASIADNTAYQVVGLVCDKPDAYVLQRAARLGIPAHVVRPKQYLNREAYEHELVRHLAAWDIDFIVLAGYMRLITPVLLTAYDNRILNVHPSLLPAFPGIHAVEQALAYGAKVVGVTVHLVDGGMDSGPIVAQEAIVVHAEDTAQTLLTRIQAVEHRMYPEAVRAYAEGRVRLEGRRTYTIES